MGIRVNYLWDEDNRKVTCTIKDLKSNKTYEGVARCHPEDNCNKLMGEFISKQRATINILRDIRDNEIKPQLAGFNQLFYSMNYSKYFNPSSYEARMLFRKIEQAKSDLNYVNAEIDSLKEEINYYLKEEVQF